MSLYGETQRLRYIQQRRPCDKGGKDWSDAATNQGTPRNASNSQKLEEARVDSSLEPSEEMWSCWHLGVGFLAFRTMTAQISFFLVVIIYNGHTRKSKIVSNISNHLFFVRHFSLTFASPWVSVCSYPIPWIRHYFKFCFSRISISLRCIKITVELFLLPNECMTWIFSFYQSLLNLSCHLGKRTRSEGSSLCQSDVEEQCLVELMFKMTSAPYSALVGVWLCWNDISQSSQSVMFHATLTDNIATEICKFYSQILQISCNVNPFGLVKLWEKRRHLNRSWKSSQNIIEQCQDALEGLCLLYKHGLSCFQLSGVSWKSYIQPETLYIADFEGKASSGPLCTWVKQPHLWIRTQPHMGCRRKLLQSMEYFQMLK